jgi:hypothetical protein
MVLVHLLLRGGHLIAGEVAHHALEFNLLVV